MRLLELCVCVVLERRGKRACDEMRRKQKIAQAEEFQDAAE